MKKHVMLVILVVIFLTLNVVAVNDLSVTFMSVGNSESTLIISPSGKVVLVDAGDGKESDKLLGILKKSNVEKIDYYIITHPHDDRIIGAVNILKEIPIVNVIDNGEKLKSDLYKEFYSQLKTLKTSIKSVKVNNQLELDKDIYITFLNPLGKKDLSGVSIFGSNSKNENPDPIDDNSICLKLTYGKNSFLILGDIGLDQQTNLFAWAFMQSPYPLKSDIIKFRNNGPMSKDIIQGSKPTYAINTSSQLDNAIESYCKEKGYKIISAFQEPIKFLSNGENIEMVNE